MLPADSAWRCWKNSSIRTLGPVEGVRASIELGPAAYEVLQRLGVNPDEVPSGRRRFAFACLVAWTERRAHLGGALAAAILAAMLEQGWVSRKSGTRALRVTAKGKHALRRALDITI